MTRGAPRKVAQPKGFVLWEGPSQLTGAPIVVVVTHVHHEPANRKIGQMGQVWILPRDQHPIQAVRTGADEAVCGDCRFRPSKDGGCYVSIHDTAQRIWVAWNRFGTYGTEPVSFLPSALRQRALRIGAWGDPAAVPLEVWAPLVAMLPKWTAYTEQWRTLPAEGWATWCMASVKSEAERDEARLLGWRTFRVRLPHQPVLRGERTCPAALESPTHGKATCAVCHLCDGLRDNPVPDVTIILHGGSHARASELLGMLNPRPPEEATPPTRSKVEQRRAEALRALRANGGHGLASSVVHRMMRHGKMRDTTQGTLLWLEANGYAYRTGGGCATRWHPYDRTVESHVRFLLSGGRQYRGDLVEQALYEEPAEVEAAIDGMVASGELVLDARQRLGWPRPARVAAK